MIIIWFWRYELKPLTMKKKNVFFCHYKARLTEPPSGHPNGGSYWFLLITNVILIQNDLQWYICISTHPLKPWTKWKVTSIAGCRAHTLEGEGPSSGTKQNRTQNCDKLWLGTVTRNEREPEVFTGKLKTRLLRMPLGGWHGWRWSFSMMQPVTSGGFYDFFFSHWYNNNSFRFQCGDLTDVANCYGAVSKAEHVTAFSHRGWAISWANQLLSL